MNSQNNELQDFISITMSNLTKNKFSSLIDAHVAMNQKRFGENFILFEILGEGGFAKVIKVLNRANNKYMALKIMSSVKTKKGELYDEEEKGDFLKGIKEEDKMNKEIQKIKPKNLFLEYYGIFETKDCIIMAMETGVSNLGCTTKNGKVYTNSEALWIISQLAPIHALLTEQGIVHCDIKPDNVVLVEDKEKEGYFIYKLLDFGISVQLSKGEKKFSADKKPSGCTKYYVAPEAFVAFETKNSDPFPEYDAYKADVYSLGVLLLKLIGVKKKNWEETLKKNPNNKQMIKLLQAILNTDPDRRPSFSEIIKMIEPMEKDRPCDEKYYFYGEGDLDNKLIDSFHIYFDHLNLIKEASKSIDMAKNIMQKKI